MKNNNKWWWLALAALVVLVAGGLWYLKQPKQASAAMIAFAKCLGEKKITMYGAYWCPHCQNEKKAFGEAFQYVPYVECTEEPGRCTAAGVKYFPTWVFPDPGAGSGQKLLVGEQGIKKLSEESACAYPKED